MRLPLFTQMPRRGLLGIWGIRTCVSQTFEPVEKVVVGPVGSPKHPKTQAKTLQNRRFKPLNRGQKRARGSFSTSCNVFVTGQSRARDSNFYAGHAEKQVSWKIAILGNSPRAGRPKQNEQRNRCYSSLGTSRTP